MKEMTSALGQSAGLKDVLAEYVQLEHRRRVAENDLQAIKDRISEIEPVLLEHMGELGMQNARCDGLTVYQRRDRYVTKKSELTTQDVVEVLRKCGLGYMISDGYSSSTLKAKVAEWQDDGAEIPEAIVACMNIGETIRLSTRK
jgi:hypothetical protein